MGAVALSLVTTFGGCGGGSDDAGPSGTAVTPDVFRISLTGFRPENYRVGWSGDRLVYLRLGHQGGTKEVLTPGRAAWERFWSTVDRLGVWNWKRRYRGPGDVIDGLAWSVGLRYRDKEVNSRGYIQKPPRFDEFTRAVSRLVGNRPIT